MEVVRAVSPLHTPLLPKTHFLINNLCQGLVLTMASGKTLVKKIIITSLFRKVLQNEDYVGHGVFTLFCSNN